VGRHVCTGEAGGAEHQPPSGFEELDPDAERPGLCVNTSSEIPEVLVDRDSARPEIVVQGHARLVADEEAEMHLPFVR